MKRAMSNRKALQQARARFRIGNVGNSNAWCVYESRGGDTTGDGFGSQVTSGLNERDAQSALYEIAAIYATTLIYPDCDEVAVERLADTFRGNTSDRLRDILDVIEGRVEAPETHPELER